MTTPLARLLIDRIAAQGPITLADYMADCLLHPVHGYYTTQDPFGADGDFTTAPEISQMFGELIGLALAQAWLDQGSPPRFTLAELGPGRGTLMADILRATRRVPGFAAAAQVVLVEASPRLRALQARALAAYQVAPPRWVDAVGDLPNQPLFLVANEFFDALPVRQFLRHQAGWAETMVGVSDGRLVLGRAPAAAIGQLSHRLADTRPGDVVEICPAAPGIMSEISRRICSFGGLALILDYGGWRSLGDTVQALRHHSFDDILAHPGAADLTAHVDFEALAAGQAHAYTTQGQFLDRLGLKARADRLAAGLTGTALRSHRAAERRLTAPEEMGTLFKVLAVFAPGAPPPPGFDLT